MAEDTEHQVTVGNVTDFVDFAIGVCGEEQVGGRLIDGHERDADGILITLANGQTFRVAIWEVRS